MLDNPPRVVTDDPDAAEAPVADATAVFEAHSAEAAIAAVHEQLGPDARILHAERLLRGGVAGFFAKRVVRLHVAGGETSPDGGSGDAGKGRASAESVASAPQRSPVDRLLDTVASERTDGFAERLRDHLAADDARMTPREHGATAVTGRAGIRGDAPAATGDPTVTFPREASATRPPGGFAAEHDDGPAWSRSTLLRLGLPASLVDGLSVPDGAGDLAWLAAFADAVRPLCRPLPTGPSLLIGPLAGALDDHVAEMADVTTARSALFRDAMKESRWAHAVAGGDGWRQVLHHDPLAVSWGRARALPDAVGCAYDLGLVLGFGPVGGVVRRARPLDVAIGLRALLADAPCPGTQGGSR